MSAFQFDPQERNFPIYGAAERSYPVKEPIDYRLWIVELIYVYSIGKEMILNEYVDQKVFRTAYRQWGAAKDEQAPISFHEAGFFRELQWKRIKHDKMEEKAIDGWLQFDYVLNLAKGTENQYIVIGFHKSADNCRNKSHSVLAGETFLDDRYFHCVARD